MASTCHAQCPAALAAAAAARPCRQPRQCPVTSAEPLCCSLVAHTAQPCRLRDPTPSRRTPCCSRCWRRCSCCSLTWRSGRGSGHQMGTRGSCWPAAAAAAAAAGEAAPAAAAFCFRSSGMSTDSPAPQTGSSPPPRRANCMLVSRHFYSSATASPVHPALCPCWYASARSASKRWTTCAPSAPALPKRCFTMHPCSAACSSAVPLLPLCRLPCAS